VLPPRMTKAWGQKSLRLVTGAFPAKMCVDGCTSRGCSPYPVVRA
jgi:hypothetical protein